MRIVKTVWRAVLLAAALGPALAACGGPDNYTAGQDGSVPPMSVAQARALVRDTILHYPGTSGAPVIVLWSLTSPSKWYNLSHVWVTSSVLAVGATNQETFIIRLAAPFSFSYASSNPHLEWRWSDPRFPGYEFLEIYLRPSSSGFSPEPGKRFVDALAVLAQAARTGIGESTPEDEARFAQVAKAYRDAAVKPLPGEDVRRYVVQATAAIRNKDFYGAAGFYEEATQLAPWWPQGHYDRALVLAAVGEYADAVREMQRYLALVPNAPNARQMQDKVYEWQAAAAEPATGAGGAQRGSAK